MTFIGYDKESKGFRMVDPNTFELQIVHFFADTFQENVDTIPTVSSGNTQSVVDAPSQSEYFSISNSPRASVEDVVEEIPEEDLANEEVIEQPIRRVSSRINKGQPSERLMNQTNAVLLPKEPLSFREVMSFEE
ncbi:hypothetical protein ACFFRR_009753 [Megaselia abdita]